MPTLNLKRVFRLKVTLFEKRNPSETMDAYVTRLKRLVQTCDYGTLADEMIRDQVLEKCYSTRVRLLREKTLTLDAILRITRAAEALDR